MESSEQSDIDVVVWDAPGGLRVHISLNDLHRLLWEAASVAAGAVMVEAPQVEMPVEMIDVGLESLLAFHDLPRRRCSS